MHLGHRVAVVVLAREEALQLELAEAAAECVDRRLELRAECGVGRGCGIALVDELAQHHGVVEVRAQQLEAADVVGDATELGRDRTCPVGVVPQVGASRVLLELGAASLEIVESQVLLGVSEAGRQIFELSFEVPVLARRRLRRRHGRT